MPGVPMPHRDLDAREPALEEPLHRALQEIRRELQIWRQAVEQRVEEALGVVRPLAAALQELRDEGTALRAKQEALSRSVKWLSLSLGREKDLSTLLLESEDPCAHFSGTAEPSAPVAHPPAFSITRRHSEVHLSRRGSAGGSPSSREHRPWVGKD